MEFVATTLFGLEEILMDELQQLGAKNIQKLNRAVLFQGDKAMLYKANLHLRTALRVLMPIHKFSAKNDDEFYKGVREINWKDWIDADRTLAVESAVNSDLFSHSHFVSLKTKDAIVDQFRERIGKRPSVDIEHPDLQVHVHIFKDNCTVSIDSSGESLHKRGYKTGITPATLSEVLAAGLIILSGWKGERPLIDPMCGSGTIAMEAALIATNTAPGVFRKDFGFKHWKDFDPELYQRLYKEALQGERDYKYKILAADISFRAVKVAEENIRSAEMEDQVIVLKKSFHDLEAPRSEGIVIMNPPYGERLEEKDIIQFYKDIGDTLKKNWQGFEAWILSSNKEALKHIGLRTSKRIHLFNGPLEVKYHKYELYAGSKKDSKQ